MDNRKPNRIVQTKKLLYRILASFSFCSKLLFAGMLVNSPLIIADTSLTVDRNNQNEIHKIKSAYIYNFLKYVDFTALTDKPVLENLKVCVFGEDPFEKALDSLVGRKAKGLKVLIKRTNNHNELQECQIVYISQSAESELDLVLQSIKDYSILTVSEIKDFTKNGGIIGFDNNNNKIVIEINLKNAIKAHIKISAMLLEIAKVIE